jgi:3-hydroxyisobutyrate dehydrogenase-like beta-hydroxyacid dehydrogenase
MGCAFDGFSSAALAAESDLIVSAVTASQTVLVAQACAPAVLPGAFFLDFNSASPGAKQRAAGLIDGAGGKYVEGAVMTSIPPYRIKVPLLLGGAHAAELAPLINVLGFAGKVASDRLGVASATKMCRSVMIKGLEAMVIESFTTARHYGVEDAVVASLYETFPGIDWEKQAAYFFQRVIEHGRRRSEEVREVAETVRDAGLTPWSAAGTADRQAWVADWPMPVCWVLKARPSLPAAQTGAWKPTACSNPARCPRAEASSPGLAPSGVYCPSIARTLSPPATE